jgi:hypothetical protein
MRRCSKGPCNARRRKDGLSDSSKGATFSIGRPANNSQSFQLVWIASWRRERTPCASVKRSHTCRRGKMLRCSKKATLPFYAGRSGVRTHWRPKCLPSIFILARPTRVLSSCSDSLTWTTRTRDRLSRSAKPCSAFRSRISHIFAPHIRRQGGFVGRWCHGSSQLGTARRPSRS